MSNPINIEQIRAKNALSDTGQKAKKEGQEGDSLSGYPSLIINNGLISCVAYSLDKGKQHERIADAIAFHLNDRKILSCDKAETLRDRLCECDSSILQRATHEALQFLAYLKRFQKG